LANIKSQIKRNRQNEKRRLRNRNGRGAARTAINQARVALETGAAPETSEAVLKAISTLDIAARKGIVHPNNAARRKSRLMKQLATVNASEPAAVEEPKAKKAAVKKTATKKK
jgi:small subunit ribosomal protein S20